MQVPTLLYCMGPAAESVFDQLKFDSDSDRDKYEEGDDEARHLLPSPTQRVPPADTVRAVCTPARGNC